MIKKINTFQKLKLKNYERKRKSPFVIYVDFESLLVSEKIMGSKIQMSFTCLLNKYQEDIACSYGYKLVCLGDKFSKPFKSHLVRMLFTISLIL